MSVRRIVGRLVSDLVSDLMDDGTESVLAAATPATITVQLSTTWPRGVRTTSDRSDLVSACCGELKSDAKPDD